MTFDQFILDIVSEKALNDLTKDILLEATPPLPPPDKKEGGEEQGGEGGDAAPGGEGGGEGEFDLDSIGEDDLDAMGDISKPIDEKVFPEEIELAKLAVRALYFNPASKSTHRYILNVDGQKVPFEKVADYFEKTKNWKPILGFVEFVMDKFEGLSSKWTERPEIRGKGILDKINTYNNENLPEEERLDNGKRVYWARIILNCLLHGKATYNINMSEVNEKNIKEVYRKLKQDFARDSRGLLPDADLKGPGIF
jgi:hypothetical protein